MVHAPEGQSRAHNPQLMQRSRWNFIFPRKVSGGTSRSFGYNTVTGFLKIYPTIFGSIFPGTFISDTPQEPHHDGDKNLHERQRDEPFIRKTNHLIGPDTGDR